MNDLPENVFNQLTFQFTGNKGVLSFAPTDIFIRRLVQVSPTEITVFAVKEYLGSHVSHILISFDG